MILTEELPLYKLVRLRNNVPKMKKLKVNEQGFIPLLIFVLAVVVALVFYAYTRVQNAQH